MPEGKARRIISPLRAEAPLRARCPELWRHHPSWGRERGSALCRRATGRAHRAPCTPPKGSMHPSGEHLSHLRHYLPHGLVATASVTVLPALLVGGLRGAGLVSSWALSLAVTVGLSMLIAAAGSAWWVRRPGGRDIVFADLMLWGWLRRFRTERRLANATWLLGDCHEVDPLRRAMRARAALGHARGPGPVHARALAARDPPRVHDRPRHGAAARRGGAHPHRRGAPRRRQARHPARGAEQARPPERRGVRAHPAPPGGRRGDGGRAGRRRGDRDRPPPPRAARRRRLPGRPRGRRDPARARASSRWPTPSTRSPPRAPTGPAAGTRRRSTSCARRPGRSSTRAPWARSCATTRAGAACRAGRPWRRPRRGWPAGWRARPRA